MSFADSAELCVCSFLTATLPDCGWEGTPGSTTCHSEFHACWSAHTSDDLAASGILRLSSFLIQSRSHINLPMNQMSENSFNNRILTMFCSTFLGGGEGGEGVQEDICNGFILMSS